MDGRTDEIMDGWTDIHTYLSVCKFACIDEHTYIQTYIPVCLTDSR